MKEIHFFGPENKNGWLDPLYLCSVKIDGISYKSSEHYYQSMKANNEKDKDWIAKAVDGVEAKRRAHSLPENKKVKDWDFIKTDVWYKANFAKFSQNHELKMMLINTGDAKLCEDHHEDKFWGWPGKNMVGELLMKIRADLQK